MVSKLAIVGMDDKLIKTSVDLSESNIPDIAVFGVSAAHSFCSVLCHSEAVGQLWASSVDCIFNTSVISREADWVTVAYCSVDFVAFDKECACHRFLRELGRAQATIGELDSNFTGCNRLDIIARGTRDEAWNYYEIDIVSYQFWVRGTVNLGLAVVSTG
jgi:hypothetical protein